MKVKQSISLLIILFSSFGIIYTQGLEDREEDFDTYILSNDVDSAMDDIELMYPTFTSQRMASIREFVERVFGQYNADSTLELPQMDYEVTSFQHVELRALTSDEMVFHINYEHFKNGQFATQFFRGNNHTFYDGSMNHEEWNMIAVIRFDPLNQRISNRLFFIITDMDRI